MKILKWVILTTTGLILLWNILLIGYFKSMSESRDSIFYPTYERVSRPYASLNVTGYSQDYEERVTVAVSKFAKSNSMDIGYGSLFQTEALFLSLKRKDIRVKIVVLNTDDSFIRVFLYKEEYWQGLSEQEHRFFLDELIEVFRMLNLQIDDVKFEFNEG